MTYVAAHLRFNDVFVIERTEKGARKIVKHRAPFFMYVEDEVGTYTTMFGTKARRLDYAKRRDMRDEKDDYAAQGIRTFESDVKPEYKILEAHYKGSNPPDLHVGFLDIEVLSRAKEGWARWTNPYAPISAITVHRGWIGDTVTIALMPDDGRGYDAASAQLEGIPDTILCETEAELLELFLELIQDCDVMTGWNSEKFDLPYIVARLRIVLGGEDAEDFVDDDNEREEDIPHESAVVLRKLSPLGLLPRRGKVESFGNEETVFSIPGLPHLDYLDLYKKFELSPRETYKLNHILQVEVGQEKVHYDGTLEQLYYNDFRKYILYNRQDVDGLVAVDKKVGFIDIANIMSHRSCVSLEDSMGSVSKIEQAMVMKLHDMGMVAQDKPFIDAGGPVAGALVFDPQPGLHDWMVTLDVKSLYPSVIRMLNISPETLVGQFQLTMTERRLAELMAQGISKSDAWGRFTSTLEYVAIVEGDEFIKLTLEYADGTRATQTAAEWKSILENGGLALTANGTVFDLSTEGIVPLMLTEWFDGRKKDQRAAQAAAREMEALLLSCPVKEITAADQQIVDDED